MHNTLITAGVFCAYQFVLLVAALYHTVNHSKLEIRVAGTLIVVIAAITSSAMFLALLIRAHV